MNVRNIILNLFIFLIFPQYAHAITDEIIMENLPIPPCLKKTVQYYAKNSEIPEGKVRCSSKEIATMLNPLSDTLDTNSRIFRHALVKKIPSLFRPNRIINILDRVTNDAMILMLTQELWDRKINDVTFEPEKVNMYVETPLFFGLFKLFKNKTLDGIQGMTTKVKENLAEYMSLYEQTSKTMQTVKMYVDHYVKNKHWNTIVQYFIIEKYNLSQEINIEASKAAMEEILKTDISRLFIDPDNKGRLLQINDFKRFLLSFIANEFDNQDPYFEEFFLEGSEDEDVKKLQLIFPYQNMLKTLKIAAVTTKNQELLKLLILHFFEKYVSKYTSTQQAFNTFIQTGQKSEIKKEQKRFDDIVELLLFMKSDRLQSVINEIKILNPSFVIEEVVLKRFIFKIKRYGIFLKMLKVGALITAIIGVGAITNFILKQLQANSF